MELYYVEAEKLVVLIQEKDSTNNVDLLIKELEELEDLLVKNCKDISIGRRDMYTQVVTDSPKWFGKRIIYAKNVATKPANAKLVPGICLSTWLKTAD